jgi:hypothetical protein
LRNPPLSGAPVIRGFLTRAALVAVVIAFPCVNVQSQAALKLNAVPLLLGMPHVGIEAALGEKTSAQLDVAASFWQSFRGEPFEVLMVIPEIRRYWRSAMHGPYIGAHIGAAAFRLQKWNYRGTSHYQEGRSILVGITLGYEQRINDRWTFDWFIGGGNSQARYRGFDAARDDAEYIGLNRSGEWIPYRGGVMVSYRLPARGG